MQKKQIYVVRMLASDQERFLKMCTNAQRSISEIKDTSDPLWKLVVFAKKYYWNQLSNLASEYRVTIEQVGIEESLSEQSSIDTEVYISRDSTLAARHNNLIISKLTQEMADLALIEDFPRLKRIDISTDLNTSTDYIILKLKVVIGKIEARIKRDEELLKQKKELLTKILDALDRMPKVST